MNELDEILLEQLYTARHIAKKMRKARRVMGPDPYLLSCQGANENRIQFFETMLDDKTLLQKKHKRKKKTNKDPDILARNPVYEWYRIAFMTTTLGYNMLINYMSAFTKKEK